MQARRPNGAWALRGGKRASPFLFRGITNGIYLGLIDPHQSPKAVGAYRSNGPMVLAHRPKRIEPIDLEKLMRN